MYRYAADRENYWLRDKCRIIAVTDTFSGLNPNSNLVKVGNQADGEVMASGLRAQGCEFKYQFMLSPTLKPEVQKKA
jgi:hypothetical protein